MGFAKALFIKKQKVLLESLVEKDSAYVIQTIVNRELSTLLSVSPENRSNILISEEINLLSSKENQYDSFYKKRTEHWENLYANDKKSFVNILSSVLEYLVDEENNDSDFILKEQRH